MSAALYQGQCVGIGSIKSAYNYAVIGQNPTTKHCLSVGINSVGSIMELAVIMNIQ